MTLAAGAALLLAVPAVALRSQSSVSFDVLSELTSSEGPPPVGKTVYQARIMVPAGEPAPQSPDFFWEHVPPKDDPGCNKFSAEGGVATWNHLDTDGCNHKTKNHDGPGTEVTVVTRFGSWYCDAEVQGTASERWPGLCVKALKATPPPPVKKTMSKAEKDALRQRLEALRSKVLLYSGAGIVSEGIAILTSETVVGLALFAAVGAGFSAIAADYLAEFKEVERALKNDPPAAGFDQVVVPDLDSARAPRVPACKRATRAACAKVTRAIVDDGLAERRVRRVTAALLATEDLLGGARQAHNDTAGALQYAALKVLLAQLAAAIAAEERAAAALGRTLRAVGVRSVRMTPALGQQRARRVHIPFDPRGLDLFSALRTKTATAPLARTIDTLSAADLELLVEALAAQGAVPADRRQAARANAWRLHKACAGGKLDVALDTLRADARAASPPVAAYLQTAIGGLARGRRCS